MGCGSSSLTKYYKDINKNMYKYKNFSPLSGGVSDAKLEKALMTHDDWMTLTNRQGMMI